MTGPAWLGLIEVVNKADLTVLAYINHLQATEKMYFF
jgi:hypothetical protein